MTQNTKNYKILVLGEDNIGKTRLIKKLTSNYFAEEVFDSNYEISSKTFSIKNTPVTVNFFSLLTDKYPPKDKKSFFQKADLLIIAFDLTKPLDKETLAKPLKLLLEFREFFPTPLDVIFVGTKADLPGQIDMNDQMEHFNNLAIEYSNFTKPDYFFVKFSAFKEIEVSSLLKLLFSFVSS